MAPIIINRFHALRVFKFTNALMLTLTAALIYAGHELAKGDLRVVDIIVSASFLIAGVASFAAVITDRIDVYQVSYALTNAVLSAWTFTLAVYAAYGLTPWGRVVIFAYVLIQNIYTLPYLLQERVTSETIDHATSVAERSTAHIADSRDRGGGESESH